MFPTIRKIKSSCLYTTSATAQPGTRTPNLLIESPYATLTQSSRLSVRETATQVPQLGTPSFPITLLGTAADYYATPNAGHHLAKAYPSSTRVTSSRTDAKRPLTAIVCRFTPYPAAIAGPPADDGRTKPQFPTTATM